MEVVFFTETASPQGVKTQKVNTKKYKIHELFLGLFLKEIRVLGGTFISYVAGYVFRFQVDYVR
jgi:hypothetical protein